MDISVYFKSIIDMDSAPVVICNTDHLVVYMNPASIDRYCRNSESLVGKTIFECHNHESNEKIKSVVDWFGRSEDNNMVFTFHNEKESKDVYMIALRDNNQNLIGYYEKHEYRSKETSELYNLN